MRKKQISVQLLLIVTFCLFSVLINPKTAFAAEEDVITKGVYIDSVDVSGMTKEEANTAVEDYVNSLKDKKVTISVKTNKESTNLESLGYESVENNHVDEALELGKSGNLIKRYKDLKDTAEDKMVYNLEFKLDDKKIKKFIKEKLSVHNIDAVNATVARTGGRFVYTDEVEGLKVNSNETLEAVKSHVLNEWNKEDILLDAAMQIDKPKYTRELVEKCNTLLGTYHTTFASSSSNRVGNLANGAKLINNTILYPGDIFSAYEKLTPFSTSNGYFEAGAYNNGMLVDSIGGGACQVTTTLYNAILLSELEVVERAAHSMTISYVDLSRDAAIAGTWKDLKFKNNTEAPVIVEAYTQGRTIYFNIWGNETRDKANRTIKFETVVVSQKEPGKDVITKDPNQPTSFQSITQSAHTGYVAELYKIVYENGKEVSRTRVNKSNYNASPKYITVGTKVEEPVEAEKDPDDKDINKEDVDDNTTHKNEEKPQGNIKPGNNTTGEHSDSQNDSLQSDSQISSSERNSHDNSSSNEQQIDEEQLESIEN